MSNSTAFNGGEGIWYHDGAVYFTTKGDNRVWALDTHTQLLRVLYDAATNASPVLRGVDNVTVSTSGKVIVAEDGGDMQLVVVDTIGRALPLLQIEGQANSEITGPAFNPTEPHAPSPFILRGRAKRDEKLARREPPVIHA